MQKRLSYSGKAAVLYILHKYFSYSLRKLYNLLRLTIELYGGTILAYSELNIPRKELCTMTRFTCFERSFGTSAQCAEASFSCVNLSAVMDAAFAVSVFVMSVLALRLQGLVLVTLISIIINSIIICRKSNLLERNARCTA